MDTPINRVKVLLITVPIGLALNFSIGWLAIHFGLPIYLDAIGTIAVTLLCGWRVGAAVGALSILVGGLLHPHLFYFVFSQLTIAFVAGQCAKRGGFKSIALTVLTGVLIGIAAAIVSAPAVALAFRDANGTQTFFASLYSGTLDHLRQSFASKEAWIEPVDKILQCTFAAAIIAALPQKLLSKLDVAGYLKSNRFL